MEDLNKLVRLLIVSSFILVFSFSSAALELGEGWNLISVSSNGENVDDSLEDIKDKCSWEGGPWTWNYDEQEWEGYNKMNPQRGYWVEVSSSCNLDLIGDYSAQDLELREGWNLVSTSSQDFNMDKIDEECSGERTGGPWWDSPSTADFDGREIISAEKGYWIEMSDSCTLEFESEFGDKPENGGKPSGNKDNIPSRDIDYSSIENKWSLTDKEAAAIAGVRKGMVRSVLTSTNSPKSLGQLVVDLREAALDRNWQEPSGAKLCSSNYENCRSSNGGTFFVSSNEGWMLYPGTPAPHCYSRHNYIPPAYGSLSDRVAENVPQVGSSHSDNTDDDECPSWLTEDILDSIDQKVDSSSQEDDDTNEEDSPYSTPPENSDSNEEDDTDNTEDIQETSSGWELEKSTIEGVDDEMGNLDISEKPYEFDTGSTGFCGEVYLKKDVDGGKTVSVDYDLYSRDYGGEAGVWMQGERVQGVDPSGKSVDDSGTWEASLAESTTVKVGIRDTNSQYCNNIDHQINLDIDDIEIDDSESSEVDNPTYYGNPRSDYVYNGDEISHFNQWQAGILTTSSFQWVTDSGEGPEALVTYEGNPRSYYGYSGIHTDTFERWKEGEISTEEFQAQIGGSAGAGAGSGTGDVTDDIYLKEEYR